MSAPVVAATSYEEVEPNPNLRFPAAAGLAPVEREAAPDAAGGGFAKPATRGMPAGAAPLVDALPAAPPAEGAAPGLFRLARMLSIERTGAL